MASRPRADARGDTSAPPTIVPIGHRMAPHEDLYHFIITRPWWQFFALIAALYAAVNAAFAAAYFAQPGSIAQARAGSFADAFFFSVQTFATIGYGAMAPATPFANALVTLEAFAGMLAAALVTGLTFAKFARPRAQFLFSDRLVVCPRDGAPTLMVRMANRRHNLVGEAQLRVILLTTETTREGDTMRRPVELKLVRDRNPNFIMSWTAMHVIDESSPLYGEGALERLRAQGSELFLTLSGLDETYSQVVQARRRYALDDIAFNARFADIVKVLEGGQRVIDYRHFHTVLPLEPDGSAAALPPPLVAAPGAAAELAPLGPPAPADVAPAAAAPAADAALLDDLAPLADAAGPVSA
jgi:inward rectifier potassium channel